METIKVVVEDKKLQRVHIRWSVTDNKWMLIFDDGRVCLKELFQSFFCKSYSVKGCNIEGVPKNYVCIEFVETRENEDKILFI